MSIAVWQMIKECIEELESATYSEIKVWINNKYGEVNENTITAQIVVCSVNHNSRKHYPENKDPRKSNGRYDFLFNVGRGKVVKYNPDIHGLWELKNNSLGILEVVQCEVSEVDMEDVEEVDQFSFAYEAHLRDFLSKNLTEVSIDNTKLSLYVDEDGRDGVEFRTDIGIIDLLTVDNEGNFYVIELKVEKGSDRVVGQILRYIGWIKKNLAKGKEVKGIIIASNISDRLKYACSTVDFINLHEYKISFSLNSTTL